jgi:hypothetical protein
LVGRASPIRDKIGEFLSEPRAAREVAMRVHPSFSRRDRLRKTPLLYRLFSFGSVQINVSTRFAHMNIRA